MGMGSKVCTVWRRASSGSYACMCVCVDARARSCEVSQLNFTLGVTSLGMGMVCTASDEFKLDRSQGEQQGQVVHAQLGTHLEYARVGVHADTLER